MNTDPVSSLQWRQLRNPNHEQRDFVMTTVPWTDTALPLMAPAVIKTVVESVGMTCLAVDVNQEVYSYSINHQQKDKLLDFFLDEKSDPEIESVIFEIYLSLAQQILQWRPKYVGLSLLSFVCQTSFKWIAYLIRKLSPETKILMGGPGCLPTMAGSDAWVKQMFALGIVDYHIRGDAEIALKKLLQGDLNYPGINSNSWQEMTREELESLPFADFNDYHLDLYSSKAIPIIGSRGCVRQCTFCDYIANWKKFQWRSADNIFNEMMYQKDRYGTTKFKFQDSLVNGHPKEFQKLMELIAGYNDIHVDKISWSGFYIFRERTPRSEQDWATISRGGARILSVGIENFNQHIRYAMGKKFSDESIIFHLEQAQKYKIKCMTQMIVGYINETQEDIDKTKQWLRDNTRFTDTLELHWGTGLGIFDNTYLGENKNQLGITMIGSSPHEWTSSHTSSTPEQRLQWARELIGISKQLGYTVVTTELNDHYLMEQRL